MGIYNPDRKTEPPLKKKNSEPLPPQWNTVPEKYDRETMCDKVKEVTRCFMPACLLETESGQKPTSHILRVAGVMGMHLLRRGQDGALTISRWAVLSLVVINLICLLSIPPVVVVMFKSVYFWYKVMLLPYAVGFFLCVYIYIRVVHHRYNLMAFSEAVADMKLSTTDSTYQLVVWTYLYPLVIAVCSMVLFFGPQQIAFAPSILVVSFVPALLDVYMGCFATALQLAFVRLTEKIESQDTWTLEAARQAMEQWFHLKELLNLYNKMFSGRIHLRLVGLLVHALSYLFIFWSLNQYGGDCGEVVVVTVLPLAEVMGRFYYYCWLGQSVICAGEGLLAAVREAAYEAGLGTCTHEVLSELANRLEVSPPSIKNWGMESLSARTYVKLSGVLMTYVVVLLQFCERSTYSSYGRQYDSATHYDHCFISGNNTSL